jgi:hypothetical protein
MKSMTEMAQAFTGSIKRVTSWVTGWFDKSRSNGPNSTSVGTT